MIQYHMTEDDSVFTQQSLEIVAYLCKHFDYVSRGIQLANYSTKVIERYKILFSEALHPDGKLFKSSLKDIAVCLDVSYLHLRKDIIERYGHGFTWLKNSKMVERAAKMILTTKESITQISYICGFSDPKYLIKYFKTYFNCTPSKFRSVYRDSDLGQPRFTEYGRELLIRQLKDEEGPDEKT